MERLVRVVIGIQARSTSHRFPRKIFSFIRSNRSLLNSIIDAAYTSAVYISRNNYFIKGSHTKSKIITSVAVLTPYGDEAAHVCKIGQRNLEVVEGPEDDVAKRYQMAAQLLNADYIVRLTADCPTIPSHVITKAITVAVMNEFDYCSNVDPRFRTAPDGWDVEVMSRRAIEWIDNTITDKFNREHVTSALRSSALPPDFKVGVIIGYIDNSEVKFSVDTMEDLQNTKESNQKIDEKIRMAEKLYGKNSVHRF